MKLSAMACAGLLAASLSVTATEEKSHGRHYEVTITNITKGQSFTPVLAMSHLPKTTLFTLADPASDELETLAEGGDVGPMVTYLSGFTHSVGDIITTDGLLGPGESVSFEIDTSFVFSRFSMAAMMIPTNDTIVALSNVKFRNFTATYYAHAYDVGTELNDELCASIPGPVCGGEGVGVDGGEGFVHVANGIAGHGDLDSSSYDWRGSVARVVIKRVTD